MSHWLEGLRARRIALNKRPADLARLIQVTPTSYFRFEAGTRILTIDKAFTLADALGCTVDDLRHHSVELERPIVPAADYIKTSETSASTGSVVSVPAEETSASAFELPSGWDQL